MLKCTFSVIVICVVFVGCVSKNYPLTNNEINTFAKENNIEVIDMQNMDDCTVILYDNDNVSGDIVVYKDKDDKIYSQKTIGYDNDPQSPITTGGVATGTSFLTIVVNSKKLLDQTTTIEINFNDGSKVKKPLFKKGIILPGYGKPWSSIRLLNEENEVIYIEK